MRNAIAEHAFYKHWGHTVAGVVALRHGAVAEAVGHLLESAAVPGDFRLDAYGPSRLLAKALDAHGEHEAVRRYVDACAVFLTSEALHDLQEALAGGGPGELP